jgi:hypothetical protein
LCGQHSFSESSRIRAKGFLNYSMGI